jgi:hypothetical protein
MKPVVATCAQGHGIRKVGRAVVRPELQMMTVAKGRGSRAPNTPAIALGDRDVLGLGEQSSCAPEVQWQ